MFDEGDAVVVGDFLFEVGRDGSSGGGGGGVHVETVPLADVLVAVRLRLLQK